MQTNHPDDNGVIFLSFRRWNSSIVKWGMIPSQLNMWGFYPSYFKFFEQQFDEFLQKEHSAI
jgi:hypothetical protein